MDEISLIRKLDFKSNSERFDIILEELINLRIHPVIHEYSSGKNIIVDLGKSQNKLGISSHFDRVSATAGANDNSSSIAVCLKLLESFKEYSFTETGLRNFFFDEEEVGLKGSRAYVASHGTKDLIGLINLQMVGSGDKFGLWNVSNDYISSLVSLFEKSTKDEGITTYRFDQIVTNYADHVSFRESGMVNAFSVTTITDQDLEVASLYYKALASGGSMTELQRIMEKAPLFQHYHKPSDTYEKISIESLHMVTEIVRKVIFKILEN